MKMNEIKELTQEELTKSYDDSKQKLLHLKIQKQTGQLEDTSQIRKVKKDIARQLTELSLRKNN